MVCVTARSRSANSQDFNPDSDFQRHRTLSSTKRHCTTTAALPNMAPGPLETVPVGNIVVPNYTQLRGVYKELAPTKFDVEVETGKKELEGFQAAKVSTPSSLLPNHLPNTSSTPTTFLPGTPTKSTLPSSPLSTSSTERTPTHPTRISSPPARP